MDIDDLLKEQFNTEFLVASMYLASMDFNVDKFRAEGSYRYRSTDLDITIEKKVRDTEYYVRGSHSVSSWSWAPITQEWYDVEYIYKNIDIQSRLILMKTFHLDDFPKLIVKLHESIVILKDFVKIDRNDFQIKDYGIYSYFDTIRQEYIPSYSPRYEFRISEWYTPQGDEKINETYGRNVVDRIQPRSREPTGS